MLTTRLVSRRHQGFKILAPCDPNVPTERKRYFGEMRRRRSKIRPSSERAQVMVDAKTSSWVQVRVYRYRWMEV